MHVFPVVVLSLVLTVLTIVQSSLAISCTISVYNEADIKNAVENCELLILAGINVPAGVTLNLNLRSNSKLIFRDTITWEFYEWDGPLVRITGTNLEISGDPNHVLDARGNLWWDGKGGSGGKTKPIFFVAHGITDTIIRDLYIKNTPKQAIWIEDSHDITIQDIYINNTDGDTQGGLNTDGFNFWRSRHMTIQRIKVFNQDDCVAIKFGTNFRVTDSYCSGGHGLSIGSEVGSGSTENTVTDVSISNIQIIDSDNGVRVKAVYGVTAAITNVIFQDIVLRNISKFGIVIEGDNVPITDFTLKSITGTVNKSGVNIYVLVRAATDWHWSDIDVKGGENPGTCQGIPENTGYTC